MAFGPAYRVGLDLDALAVASEFAGAVNAMCEGGSVGISDASRYLWKLWETEAREG